MTGTTQVLDAKEAAERFREHGYVVLPQVVVGAELAALQAETQAQIDAGPERTPRGDFVSKDGRFFRIQHLADKQLTNDSLLLALAHPTVLGVVEQVVGPDWTTYGSALVFKAAGGGPAIELHRDTATELLFDPEHVYFNVDIYLDEADAESGVLSVVPGSHLDPSVRSGELVPVPMQPGDVLVHDAMLLHGSEATGPSAPLRRVLYYSYQSAGWMVREGVIPGYGVDRRWVAQMTRLVQHAIEARRQAPHLSDEVQHELLVPAEWADDVAAAELSLRPVNGGLPWEKD